MFDDVWLSKESKKDSYKRLAFIVLSFALHFIIIFIVIFGNRINPEPLPELKVIDVFLAHKKPIAPASMRAAKKKTQKRTRLVDKDKKIEKREYSDSALITPVEVPQEISDEDDEFLVSDVDFGAGGGVEGGVEGGSEGGVIGGSILGEYVEEEVEPVRITGEQPELIKYVKPEYPEEALKLKLTGFVIIEARVGKFGRVKKCNVIIVEGHSKFEQAAVDAVMQWVYKPYLVKGKPTPFIITARITFDKFKG